MAINIRQEQPADIEAIRQVHSFAFPSQAEADLVEALRKSGNLKISLVAEMNGTVAGHIAFSPVAAQRGNGGLGLAPVAVIPQHQRQGIGTALIQAGLSLCRERKLPYVVVLGEPDYYRRFGFVPASQFGLFDEYGGGDAFAVMELQPGKLPTQAGLVKYGPEFAALA